MKRTYDLAPATVRLVRDLTEDHAVAPTEDAVIELAVAEMDRALRELREGDAWAAAVADPDFVGETAQVEAAYGAADMETWPR